jgi:hypothetical protein
MQHHDHLGYGGGDNHFVRRKAGRGGERRLESRFGTVVGFPGATTNNKTSKTNETHKK